MVSWISLLVIALAVSLDGGGVGLLYGARRIRIPWLSLFIISACSGLVIWSSMKAGQLFAVYMQPETSRLIGASILVVIGIWAVIQFMVNRRKEEPEEPERQQVISEPLAVRTIVLIELKKLGLVIQILRRPSMADMDRSGNISAWEASLLGVALSLDALGAGIGAALVGFPATQTALLIGLVSGLFLFLGLRVGRWAANIRWVRNMTLLPGLLLIAMGIMKLL